jgi:threonyl-tRNA synthetase
MNHPDHRRLGRQLEIFATEEQCGAGLPLWLPAGAAVRHQLERYVIGLERRHGYRHVSAPAMAKRELYERSDHRAHYHDHVYPPMAVRAEEMVLCPHHILIYAQRPRGLRELPYRLAEVGPMFRRERSGVVGGLSRVRKITLNDGHVFCAPEQAEAEIADILGVVTRARPPSTDRRSTCMSAIRRVARRPCQPSKSTSTCPARSGCNSAART